MIDGISIAGVATFDAKYEKLDGLSQFNYLFGTNGTGKTTISRVIANKTPAKVAADSAYQKAMKNSDKKTARIELEAALQRVMIELLADRPEVFKQFSCNPSSKKWLGDTTFAVTYKQQIGQSATGESHGR